MPIQFNSGFIHNKMSYNKEIFKMLLPNLWLFYLKTQNLFEIGIQYTYYFVCFEGHFYF